MIPNWSKIKISQLCNLIVDCVNKTAPHVDFETPYKMIRTSNIKDGVININKCKFVTRQTYEKWTRRATVDKGDVLLTREAPMGEVGLVNFQDTVFLGQRIMQYRANPEKLDSNYLLYVFLSPFLKSQFRRYDSSGSIVSHITVPDCFDFEIPLPPLETQKSIGQVLSNLDKKIELNKKINSELETMTKLIYDYWFLQFNFPDENGKPYQSSGGQMVYNKDLKRNVPYGWKVQDFGIYNNIRRGDIITSDSMKNGKVKVVSSGAKSSQFHDQANRSANIITVSSSGNAGYVNFWREPIFASDCITVQSSSVSKTLLAFQFLKMLQKHLYRLASGSVQQHVYPSDLEKLKYLTPPQNLIDLFEQKVIEANQLIACKYQENEKLEKLRDWLLPMLMNGQVTVKG